MGTPYRYQSFTLPREFRLLKVCQDCSDESQADPSANGYSLDLITTTLDDAPQYEAVSYVWGPSNREAKLVFRQGGSLMITPRLAASLKELVKQCDTGYLWIDQICINQEDEEEKAHQIPLMGDIYSLSAQVLIYLALDLFPSATTQEVPTTTWIPSSYKGTEALQQSEDYMRNAAAEFGNGEESIISYEKVGLELAKMCKIRDQHEASGAVSSGRPSDRVTQDISYPWVLLNLFFKHPWFCRAWTFQEFALAQKAQFMAFGLVIDSGDLRTAVASAEEKLGKEEKVSDAAFFLSPGIERFRGMFDARSRELDFNRRQPTYILNHVLPYSEVSVRQDCIYAFSAFFSDSLGPPVDYSLSWTDLFVYVTMGLAHQSGSLFALCYLQRENTRQWKGREKLPSWVPNWSERQSAILGVEPKYLFCFSADLERHHRHKAHDNVSSLRVAGRVIARTYIVFAQLNLPERTREGYLQLIHFIAFLRVLQHVLEADIKVETQCESCTVGEEEGRTAKTGLLGTKEKNKSGTTSSDQAQIIIGSLLRIAATNRFIHGRRTTTENFDDIRHDFRNDFSAFVPSHVNDSLRDGDELLIKKWHVLTSKEWPSQIVWDHHRRRYVDGLTEQLRSLMTHLFPTAVFLTNSRDFGYTYGSTQMGDLVCILHGSRVPVILRPVNEGSDTMYKVIGWCYLDNAMFGEAVTWDEEEAQEFVLC